MPRQVFLDLVKAAVDGPDHDLSNGPAVPALLAPLDLDLLAEGPPGQAKFGHLAEGLSLLGCVNASNSDMNCPQIHQHGEGVAISYGKRIRLASYCLERFACVLAVSKPVWPMRARPTTVRSWSGTPRSSEHASQEQSFSMWLQGPSHDLPKTWFARIRFESSASPRTDSLGADARSSRVRRLLPCVEGR